jgi:hypothetical protein
MPSLFRKRVQPGELRGLRALLNWAVSLLFLGHAWVYVFWDAPFRELLWDQALMEPVIEGLFGMPWSDFVTDLSIEARIQSFGVASGIALALGAVVVHLPARYHTLARPVVVVAVLILSLQGFVEIRNGYPQWGVALEYAARWTAPVLWLMFHKPRSLDLILQLMRLAVAATFVGHGLYAADVLPLPGHFLDMSMNSLGLGQREAVSFLWFAGILDFLTAALLFAGGPWNRWAAIYMFFWGLSTSLARVAGHWHMATPQMLWGYWLFQAMLRAPHFLLPLALLALFRRRVTWTEYRPSASSPDPGA